jgi:hypothetical protein
MNTFNLLNIYFYKITELRKFCVEFNLATNGTKTNIIDRILQYYLINTHTRKSKLCDNMRCKTCFDNSFLSNDKSMYWDYTKNNIIDKEHPRYIFKGNSNNKYWFICNKCNHNFDILLGSITVNNRWCRYCANQELCVDDCQICFNKSFASDEKAIYWDYEKNKNSKYNIPRKNFKGNSSEKYWFICNKCNHSFDITLSNISTHNRWCRYCANQELCVDDCQICFNKSFASDEKAIYWDYEKNKNSKYNIPRKVSKGNSSNKYWFICNKCSHSFDAIICNITNNNSWCRYCASQVLCENNNCEICYNKSFASHEKAIYWDYEKNKNSKYNIPRKNFKGSDFTYWFICNNCNNSFDIIISSITQNNRWCPICVNKTEKLLYDYFTDNKINFIKEYTITNGKFKNSNKLFRYDFYLTDYNIIIELDGIQHFEFVKHFKNNFKLNQYKDCFKMKFAINNINNVKIIRISQEDVYKNKINYKELLQELLNTNTLTNLQQITYISADTNLYDKHTQYMKLNITELNF